MSSGPDHPDRPFTILPATPMGMWSVGMAVAGLALLLARAVGPMGWAMAGLALELAAGVTALLAITREGERALLVYAAMVPFLMAVVFLIAEIVEILRSI